MRAILELPSWRLSSARETPHHASIASKTVAALCDLGTSLLGRRQDRTASFITNNFSNGEPNSLGRDGCVVYKLKHTLGSMLLDQISKLFPLVFCEGYALAKRMLPKHTLY